MGPVPGDADSASLAAVAATFLLLRALTPSAGPPQPPPPPQPQPPASLPPSPALPPTSTSSPFLPALVVALHPLTLYALVSGDARGLVENALLALVVALAERPEAVVRALALLPLAAATYSSPLQGLCLALAIAPAWLGLPGFAAGPSRPAKATSAAAAAAAQAAPTALYLLAGALLAALSALGLVLAGPGVPPPSVTLLTESVDARSVTPELSGSWYLFAAAFLRSSPYFSVVVWAQPLLYAVPLALRFR
jgi:hypothetical protein